MRSLHVLGHHTVTAALTVVVSVGVALAMAAPAAAAPGSGSAPAGIAFLTIPPSPALVGSSYTMGVRGDGADTPVELSTQDAAVCSVSDAVVTFDTEGFCVLEAHQDADTTHAEADAAQLIEVDTAPLGVVQPVDPSIASTLMATAAPARGWYRSAVTVTFRCSAGSSPVTNCPAPVRLTRSAAGQSVTRDIVAADGGSAAVTVGPLSIDRSAPRVAISGVHDGASYRGDGPRVGCRAADGVSGVAGCSLTSTQQGHVVTVRAVALDRAGNSSTTVVRYRVRVG